MCDRTVECVPDFGTHEQCVQPIRQIISCGSAKAIGATYDRCIDQLQSDSCPVLFPNDQLELPADCNDVILARTVPGVSQWSALVGDVATQSAE